MNARSVLGFLLHHANRHPEDKASFYPIKERILKMWGKRVGADLQHIPGKTCNRCEKGRYWKWMDYGRTWGWEPCWGCGGTGWYKRERWIVLNRYRLGRYEFHVPGFVKYGAIEQVPVPLYGRVIEGYVEHDGRGQYWLDDECELWLYVLFNPLKIPRVAYMKAHYIASVPLYLPILFTINALNKIKELD